MCVRAGRYSRRWAPLMLTMLSEASIASWCSPSQASPSYTPSRRRLRLRHWCSPKQISLVQTPRAGIARLALAGGSMLLQNLASSLSKVLFTTQLASELACPALAAVRVLSARTRDASRCTQQDASRPWRWRNSFEFYGLSVLCMAGIRSHRQLREANKAAAPHPQHAIEQFHHCRKGLPQC